MSVVCSGFVPQAKALAQLSGMNKIAIAEYPGHASSDDDDAYAQKVRDQVVDSVIAGLVGGGQ